MRIGVDATCWQNRRGYGRHARSLLCALVEQFPKHEYTFFLDSELGADSIPRGVQVKLVGSTTPTAEAARADGRRSLRDMWRVSRAISTQPLDVLLFPTIYSFVPTATRARKLVIMHDVTAETFPQLTMPSKAARLLWRAKVALGRMQADTLITVSDFSRNAIARHFGIARDAIQVVGEASDPIFRVLTDSNRLEVIRELGLPDDRELIVYVGGFSPHKNVPDLLRAFHELCDRVPKAVLILAGELESEVFHSHIGEIRSVVEELKMGSSVVFTGRVSDEFLVRLLNHAMVLVLPSLMEGFGLPAVEAAACGCPVIATKHSPLPQLLGDGGMYIEPGTAELPEALLRVVSSPALRERMRAAAIRAAQRLTWKAAAARLMQVISGETERFHAAA